MAQTTLTEAIARGVTPDYIPASCWLHLDAEERTTPKITLYLPAAQPTRSLAEPLSQRELEVLHLIAQGLSNREISGERLFLALDTVKGHNRGIFGKLRVQRRTEAVAKARSLNLLPPQ